jgi:transcriptional regulator with XRE-family HTH domain
MNIKKVIKSKGFTLGEVAARMKKPNGKVGLPQSALSQLIINGNPTFDKLQEIASIIGVSVSELVADEKDASNTIICPHCGKPIKFEKV